MQIECSMEKLDSDFILYMLLCPILVSVSMSLFQMTLALFIKPLFSFMVTASLIVAATYFVSPVFI